MATINISQAFNDKRIFADALGDIASWQLWLTILCAAFALPLDAAQLEIFAAISGGRLPPTKTVRELWVLAARRSGKSRIAALVAVFIALFVKHRPAPGERPMVLVIAGSLDQAATVFGYVKGFLEASPVLRKEIVNVKRHEIELRNHVIIGVHSNSFRTVRGRTLCACVMDEVSFWKDENSATPDVEMYRAIMPALATTRLVVQGASKLFNPSLSDELIAAQRAADPTSAASEWDALFRDDLRGFLSDDLIDAAVEHSRPLELPPRPFPMHYKAACDASGGAGLDAYTISIGHRERLGDHDFYITDLVRGTRGKFDPHEVTKQYAALLKEYRITSITGDRYSKEWVAGAWRAQNIHYIESELNKSQIYLECEPLFARGLVRLPDHPTLLRELRLLERQAHRGGRESVDHPRGSGQHDDYANSVCLVLHALSNAKGFTASDMWMANHGIE